MSALVLPRLFVRPLTLWNLALAGMLSAGFLLAARGIRGELVALSLAERSPDFVPVAVTFVASTILGAIVASSVFELLCCPFSAALPALLRRARNETALLVAACTLAVAAVGMLAAPTRAEGLALALFAAFGMCVGVFTSDPRSRPTAFVGFLTLIAFLAFTVEAPEIFAWVVRSPWIAAPLLLALGAFFLWRPFVAVRQRARATTRGADLDRAYRELDLRSGTWGSQISAPRAGTAPRSGTRRTDLQWALATLHETQGFQRGGWIGSALTRAAIGAVFVLVGQWVVASHAFPDADRIEQLGWLVKRNGGSITLWFVLLAVTAPFLPAMSTPRPLARPRQARIAWLGTLIEEGALLAALLGILAALAALVGFLRPQTSSDPSWPSWYFSTLVATALLPLARWARLRFLDTAEGNPGPARQGLVCGIVAGVLLLASIFALQAWAQARPTAQALQIAAWSLAVVIGRGLWLAALERHMRTRDLAT